ncbi:MAG: segregation/condensation protein A [Planctomycetota bacterium]|nr:segregation/condensation protein A [Planctomycetota bacterium]
MADAAVPNTNAAPAPHTAVGNRVDFSARLESFQGPLDLLLYLIKENEVEITDIPIARILEQYLRFLDQAAQWDLQLAGEFLVMAATLMEIKSRELLPPQEQAAEGDEIIEDPRSELVRQLLAYRRLKDQASALAQLQDTWEQCRPRGLFGDVPEPDAETADPAAERAIALDALVDVDIYAIFAAYERMARAILAQAPGRIVKDTETIEQKVARIEVILKDKPFTRFAELVTDPGSRADIAATFVALLELVRRRAVRLIQQQDFGSIDVRVAKAGEMEAITREEMAAAEAAAEAAIKAKAEQDAALAAQAAAEGSNLPWIRKRRPPRPHFHGVLRPEDVEEIDAEETEIARRIDAILAAADAISERFEQSHEGRVRDGETAPAPDAPPAPEGVPAPPPPAPPAQPAAPPPQEQAPPPDIPKGEQRP